MKELRKFLSSSFNDDFQQQTFLGCTVKDFNVNGGFGDSVSTLNVELVPDEYNKSDCKPLGFGDDVYHNGLRDKFNAPLPGSPVFFKFGPTFCSINKAYMPEYNLIYGTNIEVIENLSGCSPIVEDNEIDCVTSEEKKPRSIFENNHFIFGGILQSYTKNSSTNGDPIYSVSINDPREILSNVTLILNNYANTVFGLPNILNVYGFLEYNPSSALRSLLGDYYSPSPYLFKKSLDAAVGITYSNGLVNMPLLTDAYITSSFLQAITPNLIPTRFVSLGDFPQIFPYTGTSYSRRGESGIPVYRVVQSIYAMMGFFGPLPEEYRLKNFGGMINFRGFNYIVDLSGIPFFKIPPAYMINFDQMSLLEFCQEVCDTISHDLHVTLLPILKDHPVCSNIDPNSVAGIIRVNAIDRSHKPNYGAINNFVEYQKALGINVLSTEVGLEMSNIPTDKFVVGAQEVNMHFFTTNEDRHKLIFRKSKINGDNNNADSEQWFISNSLRQQVLPFYGFLGKDAVTIPRGYGPYQQILLDSTGLNANGVGNYYVATQMELRAALISYEEWKEFLLKYNDVYMERIVQGEDINNLYSNVEVPPWASGIVARDNANYAISVPRCVFRSDRNYIDIETNTPASPCSPPYGWPLYYKRAEMIGIPDKGIAQFYDGNINIITNIQKLVDTQTDFFNDPYLAKIVEQLENDLSRYINELQDNEKSIIANIIGAIGTRDKGSIVKILSNYQQDKNKEVNPSKSIKKRQTNAMKVYEFVKQAAQNLGTKWLVKIPKVSNPYYSNITTLKGDRHRHLRVFEIEYGPYGFIPRDVLGNINSASLDAVRSLLNKDLFNTILSYGAEASAYNTLNRQPILNNLPIDITQGALKVNYDFIKESYVFNYEPEPQGGYLHNDLYRNLISSTIYSNQNWQEFRARDNENYPVALKYNLLPLDPFSLMNENRISAYVRFDNSQYLDLSNLPKESYTQSVVNNDYVMPDISLDLDQNLDTLRVDENFLEYTINKPKTCVFVKCDLDARFYMPPKYNVLKDSVYGQSVEDRGAIHYMPPEFDGNGNRIVKLPVYISNMVPKSFPSQEKVYQEDFIRSYSKELDGEIILTDPLNQDTNHIYAIITLPGFVGTNINRKYEQSILESKNTDFLLHIMMNDVVNTNIPGFKFPEVVNWQTRPNRLYESPTVIFSDSYRGTFFKKSKYQENFQLQAERETFALSLQMKTVIFPSPICPDLVVLPLRSNERCYGPWISSFSKPEVSLYRNVPGKVEFVKDENLAPWNYGGYDLMNQAGFAFAEFSSNILLYEEKGSITVASLPAGNSLLRPLISGGPLVTNMDVRIGSEGVNTTYSMSTYSPRFGNLQKSRNDMISKIGRDRQKLLDDKNDYIKRGIFKTRGVYNVNQFIGANIISSVSDNLRNSIERSNLSNSVSVNQNTLSFNNSYNDNTKESNNAIVHTDIEQNVVDVNNNGIGSQFRNSILPPLNERNVV